MGSILVASVIFSLTCTFICALIEAALYAVPFAYVKHLAEEEGGSAGKILLRFKEDMSDPITAILVLNTTGAILGSAVVGAAAGEVFDQIGLAVFAVVFSLTVLYFAEVTPKILGVTYARQISRLSAPPLMVAIAVLKPLILLSRIIKTKLDRETSEPTVSHQEVLSMAAIGQEEGALDEFEGEVISNVIELDKIIVRDILTPRVVVFRLPESTEVPSLKEQILTWSHTRVPIHADDNPDVLIGYVMQRDVFRELLTATEPRPLKSFARPLAIIPELMKVDQLLKRMFTQKEHICGVVDEHGTLVGVITLEDIIEEIVGHEIVDEYDTVSDLRSFARVLRVSKASSS